MRFSIRPAVRKDAGLIEGLMSESSTYFRSLGVPNRSSFDAVSYRRDGFGPDPAFSGLVADTGTDLVGYLFYHHGYDVDDAARVLYVIDFYVRSDSRRLGVGRALMDETVNACRRLHGSQVCWSVYNTNAPAFSFYENLGANYIEDQRFMRLDV